MSKINRMFCDIETSPNIGLFWTAGWKQQISYDNIITERAVMCICWKWEGSSKVQHLQWQGGISDPECDKSMLNAFIEELDKADEVVAHNGDRFDIPWLRTRCLYHNLSPWEVKSVDTLQWARRKFKFNSNRLDYIGSFLSLGGKIKTDYGLWKDIVLRDCPKAMDKMVRYCKRDVKLLEEVYHKLADYQKPKTHIGVLNGEGKWSSPYTGGTNVYSHGKRVTAAGTVQRRMKCRDTNRPYMISDTAFKEYQEWRKSVDERKATNKTKGTE